MSKDTPGPACACSIPLSKLGLILVPVACVSVYLAFFHEPAATKSVNAREAAESPAVQNALERYAETADAEKPAGAAAETPKTKNAAKEPAKDQPAAEKKPGG